MSRATTIKQDNLAEDMYYLSRYITISILCICILIIGSASPALAVKDAGELIERHIRENYPWKHIEIRDVRVTGDLNNEVPEKIITDKGPIGRAVFVLYTADGNRVIVRAHIKAYDWIVVSKRPFRKGHVIKEDDIYMAKEDITRMRKNAIKNRDMVIGKSLKRSIVANMPLTENMINKHKLVKRGKMVTLLIADEGFSISASGKTKEKGYVGKTVRAVNLSSKKEVTGVLIDETTLKVEL